MSNLKTPNQFINFLKKNKVFRQFKDALAENQTGAETDLGRFLADCYDNEEMTEVFSGFLWADTDPQEQGFAFWDSVDKEWTRYYYDKGE